MWVTSENSTKQLECRLILTQSSSLDPIFSSTVSGVDRICPSFHANCLPAPLSSVDCPCPWFHANCLPAPFSSVDCPCPWFHANCLSASFLQPTLFRVPLPLPDTARFQVQKPFVWFRAKTDKGIVCLVGHLYSVTKTPHNKCPGYDTKQSVGKVPVMLEL